MSVRPWRTIIFWNTMSTMLGFQVFPRKLHGFSFRTVSQDNAAPLVTVNHPKGHQSNSTNNTRDESLVFQFVMTNSAESIMHDDPMCKDLNQIIYPPLTTYVVNKTVNAWPASLEDPPSHPLPSRSCSGGAWTSFYVQFY